ncbi:enoyl-CoA hydratase/isomerase family protein [Thermodesulfobacteriota bacterium]
MDFKEIIYTQQDGVGLITLNRPELLNAFSPTMLEEWVAAIEDAKFNDDVRVLVVTGAGRGFCSGANVKEMAAAKQSSNNSRFETQIYQKLPRAVEGLNKPYIAAVNGAAVGGGFDSASMADIRIASDTARFAINHLRIARLSADGGLFFLSRILGVSKTLELVLTQRFFDAKEALQMGYVNRVAPHDELMSVTLEFALGLAKGPPVAMQLAKQLIYRCPESTLARHLEDMDHAMAINERTEDYIEGPKALGEKRAPKFTGR